MFSRKNILLFFIILLSWNNYAQEEILIVKKEGKQLKFNEGEGVYNALSPSKAAFYSAIFPGMGQAYNKKYWKVPIVWGILAGTTYLYLDNNSEYKRYRTAFRLREASLQDEFTVDGIELISRDGLINAQKQLRKNRDLALVGTVLVYVLQVIEASVNAHLLQFNTSDDLTLEPSFFTDPIQIETPKIGLSLTYTF